MGDREEPPIIIHHQNLKFNATTTLPQLKVMYRDPATGVWLGPVSVIFNGRGYMCVSTDKGPVWVPIRAVKPVLPQGKEEPQQDHNKDRDEL